MQFIIDDKSELANSGTKYFAVQRNEAPAAQVLGSDETAEAWRVRALELARWAYTHLANRTDACVWYVNGPSITSPDKADRKPGVIKGALGCHFKGLGQVALHAINPVDNTSRWGGIDIDAHGDVTDEQRATNWMAALHWHTKLELIGFRPLLIDSNGRGGYHIWIVFDSPVPTAGLFAFLQEQISDYDKLGLTKAPETFPKQHQIRPTGYGNVLRLPGKHPKHNHYSKMWDNGEWLEGEDGVDRLLSQEGDPPELIDKWLERGAKPCKAAATAPGTIRHPHRNAVETGQAKQNKSDLSAAAEEITTDLAAAVRSIPQDVDYDEWIRVGMALKTELGDDGFALWDSWSSTGQKYRSHEMRSKWDSFSQELVTAGTIFHLARQHGWVRPPRRPQPSIFEQYRFDPEETPGHFAQALRASLLSLNLLSPNHDIRVVGTDGCRQEDHLSFTPRPAQARCHDGDTDADADNAELRTKLAELWKDEDCKCKHWLGSMFQKRKDSDAGMQVVFRCNDRDKDCPGCRLYQAKYWKIIGTQRLQSLAWACPAFGLLRGLNGEQFRTVTTWISEHGGKYIAPIDANGTTRSIIASVIPADAEVLDLQEATQFFTNAIDNRPDRTHYMHIVRTSHGQGEPPPLLNEDQKAQKEVLRYLRKARKLWIKCDKAKRQAEAYQSAGRKKMAAKRQAKFEKLYAEAVALAGSTQPLLASIGIEWQGSPWTTNQGVNRESLTGIIETVKDAKLSTWIKKGAGSPNIKKILKEHGIAYSCAGYLGPKVSEATSFRRPESWDRERWDDFLAMPGNGTGKIY